MKNTVKDLNIKSKVDFGTILLRDKEIIEFEELFKVHLLIIDILVLNEKI